MTTTELSISKGSDGNLQRAGEMTSQFPPNHPVWEGLAAIAITLAEMGATDGEIVARVGDALERLELTRPEDVRAVAAAVGRMPQPLDEPADTRERRRPIEKMLGLPPPEEMLIAALRTRQVLEAFANELEAQ